jgi:hypothetical protein
MTLSASASCSMVAGCIVPVFYSLADRCGRVVLMMIPCPLETFI